MQAIDFVVRTGQGRVERGQLQDTDGKLVLTSTGNSDISLNIGRNDVDGYSRVGNDLVIELEDGREIVIEGLFTGNGGQTAKLYFSEGGAIEEISFTESWGRTNHAHVSNAGEVDGLVFGDSAYIGNGSASASGGYNASGGYSASGSASGSASASASGSGSVSTVTTWELHEGGLYAGLLGVGGYGLSLLGGGGSAVVPFLAVSDEIRITDIVSGGDGVVNANEMAAGPQVTGITEPNLDVTVTIEGTSVTTTSDADGRWVATFDPANFPEGEYTTNVVATATSESGTDLTTTATMTVDTFTTVDLDTNTIEGDGVVLASEVGDGVQLTGSGQPGAEIVVTFQGDTRTTTVTDSGSWTVNFAPASVQGINDELVTVSVQATDAAGNVATSVQTVRVDTVIGVEFDGTQAGDNVLNETEVSSNVTFTGATEPGNTVTINLNGTIQTAVVDSNGNWTVDFPPSAFPSGTTTITLVAIATDPAGNSSSSSHSVQLDGSGFINIASSPIEIDNVVNGVEAADGFTVTGTTLAGSTVVVEYAAFTGNAVVDSFGNWTIDIPASVVQAGEYTGGIVATATTASGNISTDTRLVEIDTLVDPLTASSVAVDNVINFAEHSAGVTVSGSVEPGSTVNVSMQGGGGAATVDAAGNWTYTFSAAEIAMGEYQTQLVVSATDMAGNQTSLTQEVQVDTSGPNATIAPMNLHDCSALSATDVANGLNVTGTSSPNSSITLTFNGSTHNAITDAAGNWTVFLSSSDLGTSNLTAPIVVTSTDAAGNSSSDSQDISIDTTVDVASISAANVAGDGVVNGVESGSNVVVTGMAEADSTVVLNVGGTDYVATVDATGAWSAIIPANSLAAGEYDTTMNLTVTDCVGNVATETATLSVDTLVNQLAVTSTSMDGQSVLNAYFAQTGVNLSGVVEQGSTIAVTMEGVTRQATVNADGTWTVIFSGDDIPIGEYTTTATIVATDAAGNTETTTSDFTFDTSTPEAPNLIAITENSGGWRSVALPFEEADWSAHAVADDGTSSSEIGMSLLHDTFRNELILNFNQDVPDGTDLIIQAGDTSGNQVSTLVIGEDHSQVDMGMTGIDGFDIEAIDLSFGQESNMTITAQQLEDLSGLSNSLLVRGETGDSVTAVGAVSTNQTEVVDGQVYDVYTLGSNGAYMVIDQDIDVITS